MHICIIGTGAAGWMTAFELKNLEKISKITIIGSPAIPTIGVGESTTNNFYNFVSKLFPEDDRAFFKFLADIDAGVKYGVFYKNWSHKDFLHAFVGNQENNLNGYLLGNLPESYNENHYMMPMYDDIIKDNAFNLDQGVQNYTFQFDANKFIAAMEKLAADEKKIIHIKDTVIDSKFKDDNLSIESLYLKELGEIKADYYVSCIGKTAFNQKIMRDEYEDYSDVLLTDKALFYPLPYTNKRKEFHPYTTAKTMKYGWRWITPTWSRIGTGYAFSSKYISIDQAIEEFTDDIGDKTIEPFVTDFHPRRIKKVFKKNYCSIGMSSGFLEPLDAPGLSMSILANALLIEIFSNERNTNSANDLMCITFKNWAAFILHQYKTSERNDTQFWIDHKNVSYDHYEKILNCLKNPLKKMPQLEKHMFFHTSAGKGHRWNTRIKYPYPQKRIQYESLCMNENHFDFFNKIHETLK
jgi:tryptophan 6-halogenase